jgi:hypothetical protein
LWPDFNPIAAVHTVQSVARPIPANVMVYRRLLDSFRQARLDLSRLGDALAAPGP